MSKSKLDIYGDAIWAMYKNNRSSDYIASRTGVSASHIRRYIIDRKNGKVKGSPNVRP